MKNLIAFLLAIVTTAKALPQNQYNYNNQPQGDDNCCEEYCYATDESPYIYFATKTSYDSLNRRTGNQHIVPNCEPVQFWSLNRHGTRLPKSSTIEKLRQLVNLKEEILRNYEQRKTYPDRGRLCFDDYNLFKRWTWNDTIIPQKGNSLTDQGISELKLLARRYKSKFPQILGQQYNEEDFFFQYTDTDRAHDSFQAYIEGLFGSEYFRVHANTQASDKLIRAYKNCPTWTDKVDRNPETSAEYNRFLEGREYMDLARDVFRKLGFKYSLNSSLIRDMYDMCRYEKAWQVNSRSPWCIAFNKDQLKFLEYGEDLKYWYKTGYGNQLTEQLGCAPLKDMYQRFEQTVNGNQDDKKATVLFTHSSTIQAVVTAMGLLKDYNPLTADNYNQQTRRNWRTSLFDPFTANLVGVLYKCNMGERYKVMFFLNEVPVDLPGCSVGLCSWTTIQEKFQDMTENCNVEEFCNGSSADSAWKAYRLIPYTLASLITLYLVH